MNEHSESSEAAAQHPAGNDATLARSLPYLVLGVDYAVGREKGCNDEKHLSSYLQLANLCVDGRVGAASRLNDRIVDRIALGFAQRAKRLSELLLCVLVQIVIETTRRQLQAFSFSHADG